MQRFPNLLILTRTHLRIPIWREWEIKRYLKTAQSRLAVGALAQIRKLGEKCKSAAAGQTGYRLLASGHLPI